MDDLFYKIEKQADNLSDLEEVVFRYLRKNPEVFAQATLDDISVILYVSTATISRTIKKLGFQNFQELKFTIQQAMHDNNYKANQSNSIQSYKQKTIEELQKTFDLMDSKVIHQVVEAIYLSRLVEVYSVGASLPIGIDLSRKLLSLGKKANGYVDWDDLLRVCKLQTKSDLAIIISLSGETRHLIEFAEVLKENEVPIVAIVGTADSRIESLATYTLLGSTTMNYYHDADISSRLSLVAIIETLIGSYSNYLQNYEN
ncbi:MurR/RpiR family transcriptional regulator [Aerococcaceae bacterium WGS1372]